MTTIPDQHLSWGFTSGEYEEDSSDWEFLCDELTEMMKQLNPSGEWYAEVKNFGWMKRNGYTSFKAATGERLLHAILPKTDCHFKLFVEDSAIKIQNFHHDSPTGAEWYTIKAA